MNLNNIKFWLLTFLVTLSVQLHAKDPKFKSELFNNGKLVYSDDFDGELNRERWGQPREEYQGWKINRCSSFQN